MMRLGQRKIETHRLRRGISVLEGSGGNIAVLTGKDGKLLIDSGFSVSKKRVAEALNKMSLEHAQAAINAVVAEGKKSAIGK